MSSATEAARAQHFRENWLTWAALHHFLSAPMLRELVVVIVQELGGGSISFEQLFEDSITSGADCLEIWMLRPLAAATPLEQYLQDRVRAFAWQNDAAAPVYAQRTSDTEAIGPSTLEAAIRLGAADLMWSPEAGALGGQISLAHFLAAFNRASATWHSSSVQEFLAGLVVILDLLDLPLSILAAKHYGDLCADVDSWDKAAGLYREAEHRLSAAEGDVWAAVISSLRILITQSLATADRNIRGAAQSAANLSAALDSASVESAPLLVANASFDALTASVAAATTLQAIADRRSIILSPPLLQDSHNGAAAMRSWLDGDFPDAHRQFWATLRRQIALGSSTESRSLKSLYARSLFAEVAKTVATQNQSGAFRLAAGLLIESGNHAAVRSIPWTEELVGAYVNESCVEFVISRAEAQPGAQTERRRVAVDLFASWITSIALEKTNEARAMLRYISAQAKAAPTSLYVPLNLGGRSLEALSQIAQKRPELRSEVSADACVAISSKLRSAQAWTGYANSLEAARAYLDVLSDAQLGEIIESTLALLDQIDPAAGAWPIVRPALELLASGPAKRFAESNQDVGRRIVAFILRFGLQQNSEKARVLFYLYNFNASLLTDPTVSETLVPVIEEVRRQSQIINSSTVVTNIQALLVVPSAAGQDGLKDAINGLDSVLASADHGVQSMALPLAYSPLLLLADRQTEIAEALSISVDTLREWLRPTLNRIVNLWSAGKNQPLIFAMFSIPRATKPDPVIVHNLAYASIRFGESIEEGDRVQAALSDAMSQPVLADSIALARATRLAAGDVDSVDSGAIRSENRESFYSALGRRLVFLQRIDDERGREICSALLDQCLRLGPRSIDAAVLFAAADCDIAGRISDSAWSNYLKRLQERDREMRLSLTPIVEMLRSSA